MHHVHSVDFFRSRWRGEAMAGTLFWRDMMFVGSFVNLLTGFVALMLVAQGAVLWLAAVVHFAFLPYNAFLVMALWRTPRCSQLMRSTSLVWLALMTLI